MKALTRRKFLAQCLRTASICFCIESLGLLCNCGKRSKWEPMANKYDKVIILGMDGLDFRIVEEMMAEGQLPNFSSLAREGSFAPLKPSNPAVSPVCWTNISTGTRPGQHGIHDFLHRNPKNYLPYIALRKEEHGLSGTRYLQPRRRDAFWTYASKAGIPTTVIRYPVTFPAEKVHGRFLSGLGVPDLIGNEGRYIFYTTAQVPSDDPSPHNVVEVESGNGIVETSVRGPAINGERFAALPMTVIKQNNTSVKIDLHGLGCISAVKGQWTDWIRLRFRIGFRKIHGIIKFMLVETEPHLELYASPIHLDPANQAFPITYPEKFGKELVDYLGLFHTLGMPEMVHPLSHGRYGYDEFLLEIEAIEEERTRMFEYELNRFNEGLLVFVFDHTDRIQHAFWSMRDPHHPTA